MEIELTKAIARPWVLEPSRTANLLQQPNPHCMFLLKSPHCCSFTSDNTMGIVRADHKLAF